MRIPANFFLIFGASILLCSQSFASSLKSAVEKINQIQSEASQLTSENCQKNLVNINAFFNDWMPDSADQSILIAQGPQILQDFFNARLALHAQLERLPMNCVAQMRQVFRSMRTSEDMIGVMTYRDQQIEAEKIQFNKQPVPLLEADHYRPYHLNGKSFEFKKGDLMITKGVSVISSTISAFSQEPTLFSHIVFVAQDEKTKDFGTIESYIGKGVDRYSMKEALQNENARILILRAKDQALASEAHDYMLNRVNTSKRISYDYVQDFSNNKALTCEEIAYDAYNTASAGKFQIPWSTSFIHVKDKKFVKNAGLRNGPMMLPADMEVDPRFEIVLDWTDYRIMRDSWRKDAVMQEIIRWINEEGYVMHDNLQASVGKLMWKSRNIKFLWSPFSKLSGIPKDFEKAVPASGIAMIANLKAVAAHVLPELAQADREKFMKTGQWMSITELKTFINKIRLEDKERHAYSKQSNFHYFFRPWDQYNVDYPY